MAHRELETPPWRADTSAGRRSGSWGLCRSQQHRPRASGAVRSLRPTRQPRPPREPHTVWSVAPQSVFGNLEVVASDVGGRQPQGTSPARLSKVGIDGLGTMVSSFMEFRGAK